MTHQSIPTTNQPDATEGKVGYKRPPVKSRFRKGQSGNPSGRRKGQRNMGGVLAGTPSDRNGQTRRGIRAYEQGRGAHSNAIDQSKQG